MPFPFYPVCHSMYTSTSAMHVPNQTPPETKTDEKCSDVVTTGHRSSLLTTQRHGRELESEQKGLPHHHIAPLWPDNVMRIYMYIYIHTPFGPVPVGTGTKLPIICPLSLSSATGSWLAILACDYGVISWSQSNLTALKASASPVG